jgi:ATP-dependent DNA helicase RecQ
MAASHETFVSYALLTKPTAFRMGARLPDSLLTVRDNARKVCRTFTGEQVPLFGLTATASFDVLADVKRELAIENEAAIQQVNIERPELSYQVIRADNSSPLLPEIRPEEGGNIKNWILARLIQDIPVELNEHLHLPEREVFKPKNFNKERFFECNSNSQFENAGLIFCPHKSKRIPSGVQRIYGDLLNNQELNFLRTGYFMGADKNDDNQQNIAKESERNQELFVNHNLNLLIATKAFGMGIDKPNVRYTIHYNYPPSIESFYQEAGRAGRDRKAALNYILYTPGSIEFSSPDRQPLLSFHRNSFKGEEKEKRVIYELLQKITFPAQNGSGDLARHIDEETGIITVPKAVRNSGGRYVIYLNSDSFGKNYGVLYINNLNSPQFYSALGDNCAGNAETVAKVAESATSYINRLGKTCNTAEELLQVLQQRITPEPVPGLEVRLNEVNPGEAINPVVIGFRNDAIERIAGLLQKYYHESFTERIVEEASSFCLSFPEFLTNLDREFKKAYGKTPTGKIEEIAIANLKKQFLQIRNEGETFKAIYRLSVVGVVEDYTVDYGKMTVTVFAGRKTDQEYFEMLQTYVSRYKAPEYSASVPDSVLSKKGNSVLQKCLGYLIEFVYKEIAEKRERAIEAMEEACEIGLKSSKDMQDFISLYFTSRYARSEYLPKDTKGGTYADFDIVVKYMKLIGTDPLGSEQNNLEHLRGACVRLLNSHPGNGALLLLNAFSLLLLETEVKQNQLQVLNDRLLASSRNDFMNGFRKLQQEKEWSKDDLLQNLATFRRWAASYNKHTTSLLRLWEEAFYFSAHVKWLKEFNLKFLDQ